MTVLSGGYLRTYVLGGLGAHHAGGGHQIPGVEAGGRQHQAGHGRGDARQVEEVAEHDDHGLQRRQEGGAHERRPRDGAEADRVAARARQQVEQVVPGDAHGEDQPRQPPHPPQQRGGRRRWQQRRGLAQHQGGAHHPAHQPRPASGSGAGP